MRLCDLHWLAGLLEGEGCFALHHKTPRISLDMCDRDIVERAKALLGGQGGVKCRARRHRNPRHSDIYATVVTGRRAVGWMMTLYPLLGSRRRARIRDVIARWRLIRAHFWSQRGGESTLLPRLWTRINKTATCWLWTGGRHVNGFGMLREHGRSYAAHRLTWATVNGPLDPWDDLLKTCAGDGCVRPDHFTRIRHGSRKPAVLTAENVRYLRDERLRGRSWTSLAEELGVPVQTVEHAGTRRTWRHVA